jgi:hypothetical protein
MERKFDAKVFRNLSLESVCDAEDTWKKVSHANLSPPEVSRQVAVPRGEPHVIHVDI